MAENDLTGAARVVNLGFHKQVTVRWTVDRWKTSSDLEARYVDDLSEGLTDTFVFRLSSGLLCRGEVLELCLRYRAEGQEHWDNNNGDNYGFQVKLVGT